MVRSLKAFRLEQETLELLEEIAKKTGKTQTQIVKEALELYAETENKVRHEIEIYKQENDKLKLLVNTLQITMNEKDKKYEDMKNNYEKHIEDLKASFDNVKSSYIKQIEYLTDIIKKNNKKWWMFWKS